ncbi:MAG: hypothetical protein ACYC8T_02190 [Myxococcaceae bacterium]
MNLLALSLVLLGTQPATDPGPPSVLQSARRVHIRFLSRAPGTELALRDPSVTPFWSKEPSGPTLCVSPCDLDIDPPEAGLFVRGPSIVTSEPFGVSARQGQAIRLYVQGGSRALFTAGLAAGLGGPVLVVLSMVAIGTGLVVLPAAVWVASIVAGLVSSVIGLAIAHGEQTRVNVNYEPWPPAASKTR